MLKLKRLFFILICFFSLVITANTARAFLPSLETIEQAWQENYSSLESFACLITWKNYPDLTTRVWFKKGNTLVEWGIKKEQEQIFGAVLFQKEQQVLSSFDFTSPLPFVVYFFYSPAKWKQLGVDIEKSRYVFWQDKPGLELGKGTRRVYYLNEYFYPLGFSLDDVTLIWKNFVYLGNFYLPTQGIFITPWAKEEFSLQWGSLNSLNNNFYFETSYFQKRYSSLGSQIPVKYNPLFKNILIFPF
ncbi:MAG: hypothetical protein PWR24_2072 [Desulfonauticus sp.]|nr:hypothetical protein [Desulfonauticus sp.]